MSDVYRTIKAPVQGPTAREKQSRFLSWAVPVRTVAEARGYIEDIAHRYRDARHVCWAYKVNNEPSSAPAELSSDNGEPSGTAGRPILGQIHSLQLSDVVVVVVRYFGGILLGAPGLIAAYRAAARAALDSAEIVEMRHLTTLTLEFDYLAINDVMRVVKGADVTIASQSFDNLCAMTLSVPLDEAETLRQRLAKICTSVT